MAKTIQLGVVLRADGRGLVGEVRLSQREIDKLGRELDQTGRSADRSGREMRQASREVDRYGREAREAGRASRLMGRAIAGVSLVLFARHALQATDSVKEMQSQIRIVTEDQRELNAVYEEAVQVALDTRSSLDATVTLYARLARSTENLGLAQSELLLITRRINEAFIASGATAQEARNAVIQLGQGLAAGQLRGEEFRSVAEQAPRLLRAISEELGKTRGELMDMAFAGELSTELIVEALGSQSEAAARISDDYAKVEVTVGQAFTNLKTSLTTFISDADEAVGITTTLAAGILKVAEAVENLRSLFADNPLVELQEEIESVAAERDRLLDQFQAGVFSRDDPAFDMMQELNEELVRLQQELEGARDKGKEAGDGMEDGARRGGDAAKEASVNYELLNLSINNVEQTAREAAIAQNNLAEAANRASEEARQALDDRISEIEDNTRTELEQIEARRRADIDAINEAREHGTRSAQELADLRRRVDEQYLEERRDLEEAHYIDMAELQQEIAKNALNGVQQGFTDFYATILDEGRISFGSLWDAFEDLALNAVSNILGAITTNLFVGAINSVTGGLLTNLGVGGGSSGGGLVQAGISKAISESGLGEAVKSGLSSIGTDLGIGGSSSFVSAPGATAAQVSATQASGGAIAPTLSFGSTGGLAGYEGVAASGHLATGTGGGAAAGTASLANAGIAGAILAAGVIGIKALRGASGRDKALRDYQRAGPAVAGGLGLQVSAGDRYGFAAGANAGFAAEYAKTRIGEKNARELLDRGQRTGLAVFGGQSLEQTLELMSQAQAKFEEVKAAGTEAFGDIGTSLNDGLIDPTEKARFGLQKLGEAYVHPKTGAIEYKDITIEQFHQVSEAINSGQLRLRALQGDTQRTAEESRLLGQIFSDSLNTAAESARGLARDINSIPTERTITIHERRTSSGGRSGGGGGVPSPQRGLAEGGIITRPTLIEAGERGHEAYIPMSGGKIDVRMKGGGGPDERTLRELASMREYLARIEKAVINSGKTVGGAVDKNTKEVKRSGSHPGLSRKVA